MKKMNNKIIFCLVVAFLLIAYLASKFVEMKKMKPVHEFPEENVTIPEENVTPSEENVTPPVIIRRERIEIE